MMVYYQIRHYLHGSTACPQVTCPLCKHKGGINIAIRQRYTWFLGPVAPGAKYGLAGCDICRKAVPDRKWTDELERCYRSLSARVKTPLRLWMGVMIVPVICAIVVFTGDFLLSQQRSNEETNEYLIREYVAHPRAGDVYQVIVRGRKGDVYHTYIKYNRIAGDTLFVNMLGRVNPHHRRWEGLNTEGPDVFGATEIPLSYRQFRQHLYLVAIDNPANSMTFRALKRDGKLIKQF